MNNFDIAIVILRLGVGLIFAAHGAQKLFGWWGGPGLAGWQGAMSHMGFRPARLFALTSALVELGGGLLLAAGFLTPFVAATLVALVVVIIGQVHWSNGLFNSKAGFEYPLVLGVAAAAVGIAGPGAFSIDAVIGFDFAPVIPLALMLAGILAGFVNLAIPRFGAVPTPSEA